MFQVEVYCYIIIIIIIIIIIVSQSHDFSSWHFSSWTICDPHHSGFQFQTAELSVFRVTFSCLLYWIYWMLSWYGLQVFL
jgi:hypothetical protein